MAWPVNGLTLKACTIVVSASVVPAGLEEVSDCGLFWVCVGMLFSSVLPTGLPPFSRGTLAIHPPEDAPSITKSIFNREIISLNTKGAS